jgi:DNA polymerase V
MCTDKVPVGDLCTAAAAVGAPDAVNSRYEVRTLALAFEGARWPSALRAGNRSPRYTTRISDLPVSR